jgi:uncharacterized protein
MSTVLLLIISSVFMTFAWYGHLKFQGVALWKVILISWGIALFEYVFQVPANRLGAQAGWTGYQLKIVQEVITLVVFSAFALFYLKEKMAWNNLAAFVLILGAVWLTFGFRGTPAH